MTADERAKRLRDLKLRLDEVHETVLLALKTQDEAAMDRAMEEQHQLLSEYRQLVTRKRSSKRRN